MRRAIITIGLAVLFLGLGRPAQAEWVTIQIEGVVDDISDHGNYLTGKVNIGDTITGWYTYDTSTPDTFPYQAGNEYRGDYWHNSAPAGVSVFINDLEFKTDPLNVQFLMSITNAGYTYSTDDYGLLSYNNISNMEGVSTDIISLALEDYSGTALSSDALPTAPPNLNLWQFNDLMVSGGQNFGISGRVTYIVPEPATLFLFSFGALGLLTRKAKGN